MTTPPFGHQGSSDANDQESLTEITTLHCAFLLNSHHGSPDRLVPPKHKIGHDSMTDSSEWLHVLSECSDAWVSTCTGSSSRDFLAGVVSTRPLRRSPT